MCSGLLQVKVRKTQHLTFSVSVPVFRDVCALPQWLNTNQTECPVCKAGVSASNVIPLYGRGADNVDPRYSA